MTSHYLSAGETLMRKKNNYSISQVLYVFHVYAFSTSEYITKIPAQKKKPFDEHSRRNSNLNGKERGS